MIPSLEGIKYYYVYIPSMDGKKITEIVMLVLGSIILTILTCIYLGISPYAVGVVIFIIIIVGGTGIWRWYRGDKSIKDMDIPKDTQKKLDCIVVLTDGNYQGNECLGSVYGEAIVATHMINDFWSGLKVFIGGEPKGYHDVMVQSRRVAIQRMKISAMKIGAKYITSHRLTTCQIASMSAEVMAYGTAWK